MLSGQLNPHIKPGIRFQADGYGVGDKGWIRFVGDGISPKQPKAIYIGVEWDIDGRGKHDGQLNNVQYFTCPPTRGAFVHPMRVHPGTSLLEAVRDRYEVNRDTSTEISSSSSSSLDGELTVDLQMRGTTVTMPVVFAGEKKVLNQLKQLETLTHITASGCGVSTIIDRENDETASDITTNFASTLSFFIADNLLTSLDDIVDIIKYCPKLTQLDISGNNIEITVPEDIPFTYSDISQYILDKFTVAEDNSFTTTTMTSKIRYITEKLQVLVVNRVPSAWLLFHSLAYHGALPELLEFHACQNFLPTLQYASIKHGDVLRTLELPPLCLENTTIDKIVPKLRLINVSENKLDTWEELEMYFGSLPALKKILLNKNLFEQGPKLKSQLELTGETQKELNLPQYPFFKSLIWLSLTENLFSSWDRLSDLRFLHTLQELRIQNNPIVQYLEEKKLKVGEIVRNTPQEDSDIASKIMAQKHNLYQQDGDKADEEEQNEDDIANSIKYRTLMKDAKIEYFVATSTLETRSFAIALLPQLTSLNLSIIRPRERLQAEKLYLQKAWQFFRQKHLHLATEDVLLAREQDTTNEELKEEKESLPSSLQSVLSTSLDSSLHQDSNTPKQSLSRGFHIEKYFSAFARLSVVHGSPIDIIKYQDINDLSNDFGGVRLSSKMIPLLIVFRIPTLSVTITGVDHESSQVSTNQFQTVKLSSSSSAKYQFLKARGGRASMRMDPTLLSSLTTKEDTYTGHVENVDNMENIRSAAKVRNTQYQTFSHTLNFIPTMTVVEIQKKIAYFLQTSSGINVNIANVLNSSHLKYIQYEWKKIDTSTDSQTANVGINAKKHFEKVLESMGFESNCGPNTSIDSHVLSNSTHWSVELSDNRKTLDDYGVSKQGIIYVNVDDDLFSL